MLKTGISVRFVEGMMNNLSYFFDFFLVVFYVIMAYQDIRYKFISGKFLIIMGFYLISLKIYLEINIFGYVNLKDVLFGIIPGIFIYIISILSDEKIGKGDGIIILLTGVLFGGLITIFALGISLFVISLFGVTLIFLRKYKRNLKIPFIPFFSVGILITEVLL